MIEIDQHLENELTAEVSQLSDRVGQLTSVTALREKASCRVRAPPVDPFDVESDFLFEDWMPGLLRAAEWNNWSEHETLIHLAGHLHG